MRLIDADKLKNYLCSEPLYSDPINERADIREHIDKMPTVDAVPVIRCKECKWFYKTYTEPYCALWSRVDTELPKETDFCSWAEEEEE